MTSRIDLHVFIHNHEDESKLDLILEGVKKVAIDTSKILAAVSAERTELAGWKTLLAGFVATVQKLSSDLAAAVAASDPVAVAQVQADLDKAATDLSADNDEAAAAIAANTKPTV